MRPNWQRFGCALLVTQLWQQASARAQSASAAPPSKGAAAEASSPNAAEASVEEARRAYREGVERVQQARWGEALAAFERSQASRGHATTTFNIGACERALGHYTRARGAFERALSEGQARPGELAEALASDARAYIAEINAILVGLSLSITPPGAKITLDGRPLTQLENGELVAGLSLPGEGSAAPSGRFTVRLDPGVHVITLRRRGYSDAVVNRTFAPGSSARLQLELDLLPATLKIAATVPGALVKVNGVDVGPAPVDVLRPAGLQQVLVTKRGFEPYEASVNANAGEEVSLRARLSEEKLQLTKHWWFWSGAAAVLAGGAVLTYALTRPAPSPPPYEGGSTGWVVHPSGN